MELFICSVFDRKAEAFMAIFTVQGLGQAIRSFEDACGDPQHEFAKHPEDFILFCLGSYDQETGELKVPDNGKYPLGSGLELRKKQAPVLVKENA